MQKKLLPFLVLFISFSSIAQNYFKGTVKEDDTSMTVTDAIVSIEGTELGVRTDLNGTFNFTDKIPNGEHVVTITKDGYVTKYFLIEMAAGKNIIMDNILIEVNKQERKRRDKALKTQEKQEKKEQKEREKILDEAKKQKEKQEKELAKRKKKLKKNKNEDVLVVNDIDESIEMPKNITPSEPEVTNLQIKYGAILNVTPGTITNFKLYEFIEEWEGTDYLLGGATKEGIDCSSFTQRLYTTVYELYIERTAQKQYDAKQTEKFSGKKFLQEGDLVFFKGSGENKDIIVHVGVYLHNGYFVNATSYSRDNGLKGVKICNLTDSFWSKRFVAGGRR